MDERQIGENFLMRIDDDIMYITVKPDVLVELDMVKEVVAVQREVLQGQPILVLLDVSKAEGVTEAAREYTSGEHVEGLQIAMAIVISSSLPMRLFANFFIKFNRPPAPTKMFNTKEQAISWLKSFT
jgi:hypothetical protein